MKRPSLPKKTAAQLRKVVLTVNFFQQLIISWKHRSGNLWCFFCGSTTFLPGFLLLFFMISSPPWLGNDTPGTIDDDDLWETAGGALLLYDLRFLRPWKQWKVAWRPWMYWLGFFDGFFAVGLFLKKAGHWDKKHLEKQSKFVTGCWWFRTPAMKSSDMKIPRFGDKEILHGWVELSTDPIWPDAAVRIQLWAESINGDLYFWMIQRLTWYWPPRLNPWMFFYQCTGS